MTSELRGLVTAIRNFARDLPLSVPMGGDAEFARQELLQAADQVLTAEAPLA